MTEHPATAEADHWSVGEVPPEPDAGTLVADRDGAAWIRMGDTAWQRAGTVRVFGGVSWATLLAERGPLTRLVPASQPQHAGVDVDAALRANDALRAELARFRGAHVVRHAAEAALRTYRSDVAGTPRLLAGALDFLGDVLNKSDQIRHDSPDATAEATDLDAAPARRRGEPL